MTLSYKQRPNIAQGPVFTVSLICLCQCFVFCPHRDSIGYRSLPNSTFLDPSGPTPWSLTATVVVTFAVVDVVNNPNVEFLTESKPNSAPRKTRQFFFANQKRSFRVFRF